MRLNPARSVTAKVQALRRAVALVWASGPRWTVAISGLLIFQGIMPLVGLYLTKRLVDTVAAGGAAVGFGGNPQWDAGRAGGSHFQSVLVVIGLLALVALASAVLDALVSYAGEAHTHAVTDHMQRVLHAKAIEVDLEYYENPRHQDTLHRAQQEAGSRPTRIVRGLLQLAQSSVSLIGIGALVVSLHWAVGLALLVATLPAVFARALSSRDLFRWRREQTARERKQHYFDRLLTIPFFAKEIRLFDLGPHFIQRARELRREVFTGRLAIARRSATRDLGTQVAAILPVYGCFAFIAYQTVQGAISLGGLVMYYQALQRARDAMKGCLNALAGLYEDTLFINNLYEFLDLERTVVEPAEPCPVPQPMREGIRFEGVSFRYPSSRREAIIEADLTVRPGEVVALVGVNGSGKTTLIKLLCRLYDPTAGRITIDGIDIRQFRTANLRGQISVVFQDFVCYYLTARENIWFGNLSLPPDDPRIDAAARDSGAERVIERLPHGYETLLGKYFEHGEELSMGEWQKIALARAFMRDAQLLVLDEPTSALDPRAEAEVFDRFRQLIRGRSAILISHRLSTVRMADCIYVIEDGRIVERGTHDELVEQGERYAHLFETQARHYQAAVVE